MTTNADTQELARAVGQLEGRVSEHSAMLQQLRSDTTNGFDQVNARFDQMNAQMNERFDQANAQTNARFDQMNARFDQLNDRIHRLLLTVIAIGGGAIAALVAMLITLIIQG